MHEFWYDYAKPKYDYAKPNFVEKARSCYMNATVSLYT